MRIIITLIFIFFSYKGFSFINYTYLICKKEKEILDNLKINENFIFYTLKQGDYLEQLIEINKDNQNINVYRVINKTGNYNFDDKLITLKENLFFRKIKLKKSWIESLLLFDLQKQKIIDNHICTITKHEDYETKINDIISSLKESWKNEYKDNKM